MSGLRAELALQEPLGAGRRPGVEPGQQAEREHVLGALLVLAGQARTPASASTVIEVSADRVHVVARQRAVVERAGGVADLGQVALGELVGVDDDRGAARAGRAGWPSARPGSSRRARRGRRRASARRGRRSAAGSWRPPAGCPAGARISAGKLGRVDRSLPSAAVSEVNRSPVSCIPSPESPAKPDDDPVEALDWLATHSGDVTRLSLRVRGSEAMAVPTYSMVSAGTDGLCPSPRDGPSGAGRDDRIPGAASR